MTYCSVRGQATDASGVPVARIVFVPLDVGGQLVDARREIVTRTTEHGDFRVSLAPGVYRVHIGRSRFTVHVPDQAAAELRDLVTGPKEA
jgi:hypothetical protein